MCGASDGFVSVPLPCQCRSVAVPVQLTVNALDELTHPFDQSLNAWLLGYVVVLNPVQQLGETPERVGLDGGENRGGEMPHVEHLGIGVCDKKASAGVHPALKVDFDSHRCKRSETPGRKA
jgi:hypothetical protein